jgi:hypothetical protein
MVVVVGAIVDVVDAVDVVAVVVVVIVVRRCISATLLLLCFYNSASTLLLFCFYFHFFIVRVARARPFIVGNSALDSLIYYITGAQSLSS